MATGNHLLPLSLDSSQLLPVEAVFLSTGTYWKRGNELFVCWKQYWKLLLKLGKSIFKDKPYSCQWTPIFFNFFRDFLKWKQLFRIAETCVSISFIQLVQTDFLPSGNGTFWSGLFFC